MEFFHGRTNFDFMSKAVAAAVFSAVLTLVCIGSLIFRGMEFGIDFTGGVLIEVGYEKSPDLGEIRRALEAGGFADAQVQNFGTARDVLVRLPPPPEAGADLAAQGGTLGAEVLQVLRETCARSGDRMPAIAVTGYASVEDAGRALAAGFQAHLAKPFEMEELFRLLETLAPAALRRRA